MIIERTKNEVVFRLSGKTKIDDLQDIADLLEYKEISSKSKASQKDVDALISSVKKGRWKRTKAKLTL